MVEQISHLVGELRKKHNFRKLKKHIKKILLSRNIITEKSKIEADYMNKDNDDFCTFFCKIAPDQNMLGKELVIMVKPDHHKQHRILR
ncbi:hypothetical protein KY345_00180, partial [Candidatus Woesearchaeota archaeon]|nr:hypothetical protein [Candidatus Woesearchaeota archaeon]